MVKTKLGKPDAKGRSRAEEVAGSEHVIEADHVIMAFGFKPHKMHWLEKYDVAINDWGGINAREQGDFTHQTTNPKIFAGGDIVRGSDLVVTAIFEGRNAAEGIMDYLKV
jgi:glutamate synthase (NADPH/NADH) small chain